MGRSELGN